MKKLTRSSNKRFAGVIGGIAEYFEIDSTLARLVFAFILVFTGFIPGMIFYIIAMMIIPTPTVEQRSSTDNSQAQSPHSSHTEHGNIHDVSHKEHQNTSHQ